MIPADVIEKHSGPFEWGVSDCLHFAADAVLAITGTCPVLPEYAGEPKALLAESTIVERVAAVADPVKPEEALDGDVVVAAFRKVGPIIGVVDTDPRLGKVFWVKASNGVVPVGMDLADKVFRCRRP